MKPGDQFGIWQGERKSAMKLLRLMGWQCIVEVIQRFDFAIGPAICRGGPSHFWIRRITLRDTSVKLQRVNAAPRAVSRQAQPADIRRGAADRHRGPHAGLSARGDQAGAGTIGHGCYPGAQPSHSTSFDHVQSRIYPLNHQHFLACRAAGYHGILGSVSRGSVALLTPVADPYCPSGDPT